MHSGLSAAPARCSTPPKPGSQLWCPAMSVLFSVAALGCVALGVKWGCCCWCRVEFVVPVLLFMTPPLSLPTPLVALTAVAVDRTAGNGIFCCPQFFEGPQLMPSTAHVDDVELLTWALVVEVCVVTVRLSFTLVLNWPCCVAVVGLTALLDTIELSAFAKWAAKRNEFVCY